MAGGITGVPNWQAEVREKIEPFPYGTLFNPRREVFAGADAEEQIAWEYHWLHKVDLVLFWFCKEQTQPIALYELGAHMMRASMRDRPKLVLGVEPGYTRETDVVIQARLKMPNLRVGTTLDYVIETTLDLLKT
jgi:hypothetical protein